MNCITLVALFLIPLVSMATVLNQPSVWSGNGTNVGTSWTSHTDAALTGFRALDNFSLSSAASISQVSWRGIYLNNDLTNASPSTTTWVIRFQADNAGVPGPVLAVSFLTAAEVNRQTLGTGFFNSNVVTVYEFTATLPTFSADANTTYWFTPQSRMTNFAPFFSWIEGTGGDGASWGFRRR